MEIGDAPRKLDIYWYMIIVLSLYAILSAIFSNFKIETFGLQLSVALLTAVVLDVAIKYARFRKFILPRTGIISALFITLILSPTENLLPVFAATAIAIVSKNFIEVKGRTLINPAALGLTAAVFIFGSVLSWWGTLPLGEIEIGDYEDYILPSLAFTIPAGIFINYKFRRLHLVSVFFLIYFAAFSAYAFATNQTGTFLRNAFFDPIIIFFAFFMLVEPMSTPVMTKGRILYAIAAALLVIGVFFVYPQNNLLLPLVILNIFVPLINKYVR